jgi:hypothetical protein
MTPPNDHVCFQQTSRRVRKYRQHQTRERLLDGILSSGYRWQRFLDGGSESRPHFAAAAGPNGAKTQLLMHTNTNYLSDLCILLGLFDKGYQLIAEKYAFI